MKDNQYGYRVFFEPQADGRFVATVPALNYISTFGETLEEARAMAKDMIQVYLESLRDDGEDIPEPDAADEVIAEWISVPVG